jgi:histidine ammonia-lyase
MSSPNGYPRLGTLADLLAAAHERAQTLAPSDRRRMRESELAFSREAALADVYGMTSGFGPLVSRPAADTSEEHADGLLAHLAVGQGQPLALEVTRLMVWLRLEGMKLGRSGVSLETWSRLAGLWNAGFTPVVPADGSVSASGDLVPLAHAALAFAGRGEAWVGSPDRVERLPARAALRRLGAEPVRWQARDALAFVNGTSASLAAACLVHASIGALARAGAALTGRLARLVRASPEAYSAELARAHRHTGQLRAAAWIRRELQSAGGAGRPLQEPYSLRCAPQIVGAVVDQLDLQASVLLNEARGCSDNPISAGRRILHGGNFHAANIALVSDQLSLCVHQLAFLAERQLALLVDPSLNGGLPPLLSPRPGPSSGFAGVQIAATSFVGRIRQLGSAASLTALPTNLSNQDHVPMALNGALAAEEATRLAWLVAGSLALALNQAAGLRSEPAATEPWDELRRAFPLVGRDRPLAGEVADAAGVMHRWARERCAADAADARGPRRREAAWAT